MTRRSILSHACPTLPLVLALALVGAVVPAPAARSQDRLDRLEKDLTILQRQVYRGGPTPGIPPGPGAAVDTELRMDRLETQMRELTGRVEDAVNGVEQVRRRLEQINSDIEVRFGQGQGQPRSGPAISHAAAGIADASPAGPIAMRGPTPPNPAPSRAASNPPPPGALVSPPRDTPTGTATLTPPGAPRGSEPANSGAAGDVRPSGGALRAGSASEQYNSAFGLLKQSDYSAAEEAWKTFIAQHPNDPLAGSAQYWLGETFYARSRYAEAASAFAEGYKRYPKGNKAADDLLKLGMSLARANQKQNACVALAQLDRDFPNPPGAIKDQAIKEKKRLGC